MHQLWSKPWNIRPDDLIRSHLHQLIVDSDVLSSDQLATTPDFLFCRSMFLPTSYQYEGQHEGFIKLGFNWPSCETLSIIHNYASLAFVTIYSKWCCWIRLLTGRIIAWNWSLSCIRSGINNKSQNTCQCIAHDTMPNISSYNGKNSLYDSPASIDAYERVGATWGTWDSAPFEAARNMFESSSHFLGHLLSCISSTWNISATMQRCSRLDHRLSAEASLLCNWHMTW